MTWTGENLHQLCEHLREWVTENTWSHWQDLQEKKKQFKWQYQKQTLLEAFDPRNVGF